MWQRSLAVAIVCAALASWAEGRTWTDSTGNYHVEAELVGFCDTMVVLKKENHQLVAVPLAKLSREDNAYLKSQEVSEYVRQSADATQTWTLPSGLKVIGRVVGYGRRDVTIQRRRGKIYVNDRLFKNLPEIYQKMVARIVAHFENVPLEDEKAFESWVVNLRGEPRTYTCEGVVLELPGGDEYGVPFFFFSEDDLKVLRPGWEHWLASQKQPVNPEQQRANQEQQRANQERESFLLQQQAHAYQQDRQAQQQIAMLQLEMTGYAAGLYNLWEVALYPRPGVVSRPLVVVVPGRDSRAASIEAVRRNPGYVAGRVAKVVRKY